MPTGQLQRQGKPGSRSPQLKQRLRQFCHKPSVQQQAVYPGESGFRFGSARQQRQTSRSSYRRLRRHLSMISAGYPSFESLPINLLCPSLLHAVPVTFLRYIQYLLSKHSARALRTQMNSLRSGISAIRLGNILATQRVVRVAGTTPHCSSRSRVLQLCSDMSEHAACLQRGGVAYWHLDAACAGFA